jgi:hypothetical protein
LTLEDRIQRANGPAIVAGSALELQPPPSRGGTLGLFGARNLFGAGRAAAASTLA